MACCDQEVSTQGMTINYADLPEETFCCMGRMAYTLACTAQLIITGVKNPEWHTMNERQKLEFGARAKQALTGGSMGDTELDRLMEAFLLAMTTAS